MSGIVNSLLSKIVSLEKALAESERMNEILIERLDEEADELSAKIDEMQYVRRQDVVRNTQLQEAMDAVEGGEDA